MLDPLGGCRSYPLHPPSIGSYISTSSNTLTPSHASFHTHTLLGTMLECRLIDLNLCQPSLLHQPGRFPIMPHCNSDGHTSGLFSSPEGVQSMWQTRRLECNAMFRVHCLHLLCPSCFDSIASSASVCCCLEGIDVTEQTGRLCMPLHLSRFACML